MSAPKANSHIPSLDGLRTISFGIVFAAHAGLYYVVPGGFGVTVFFFLSGFLITSLLRLEFDRTRTVSLRNFYVRRVLRILPPFYLILFAASLLTVTGVIAGAVTPSALLAQALHYANYYMVSHGSAGFAPGTGVYWSLAVEEHFYLLFPVLYLSLRKRSLSGAGQAIVLVGLCGLILIWRLVLVYGLHAPMDRTYVASDTRFDSILFGCALAVFGNPMQDESRFSDVVWKYLLLPAGLVGLLASFLVRDGAFRETFRYTLQGISLIPVFACAMRYPTWGFMRVLNWRPVAFVGVLSYSLYLIHQVVLALLWPFIEPRFGEAAVALACLAVSLGLAWLVHVFVERPFARLRKRFSA